MFNLLCFRRELQEKMRVFSQFHTAAEHERLVESIMREKELRMRISELVKYRSLGLQTQEDILHYEQHIAFQKQQEQRKNKAVRFSFVAIVCSLNNLFCLQLNCLQFV